MSSPRQLTSETKQGVRANELFQRRTDNPILTAQDWPYPANSVFNAGACQFGEETLLLVRVEDRLWKLLTG